MRTSSPCSSYAANGRPDSLKFFKKIIARGLFIYNRNIRIDIIQKNIN